jgi:DnaJ-class molecular chaperone
MTQDTAPLRCPTCQGSGEGQCVVTAERTYTEPCRTCIGEGQLRVHLPPECADLMPPPDT